MTPSPILAGLRRSLEPRFGRAEASEIVREARARNVALRQAISRSDSRAVRLHLEQIVLPSVALNEVLRRHGLCGPAAADVVRRQLGHPFAAAGRFMRAASRLPGFYGLVRRLIGPLMRTCFPAAGWTVEWIRNDEHAVAFDMHRCVYVETLRALGHLELAPLFCATDRAAYGSMVSVRFDRTDTIAAGGDHCDFAFVNARR